MEEINLKSNLLIKLFGKSAITFDEMQEIEEFLLDGEGIAFSDEEINNIQSDLEYVFNGIKEDLRDISIANCPNSLRDYIIKKAPTENIYFEGYEEFYDKLKENKIEVSDECKKIFGDQEANEYKLFQYVKTSQLIELKHVITMQDYELIKKYAKLSDFTIKINNMQEYEQLLTVLENEKVDIIITKDMLGIIGDTNNELLSNLNFEIELKDMTELSKENANEIAQRNAVKGVYLLDENGERKEKNCYAIDEYILLNEKIEKILSNIDESTPEIERFMKIYQTLANVIEYEFDDDGKPAKRKEAHNLKGGLIEGRCVCEGYAKILEQILKCSGIDCKYIVGQAGLSFGEESRHAWNQVKIDGVWYNCDLTWDAERIRDNRSLDDCLKSDRDFILHDAETEDKMECIETYDRNKINKYLGYSTALEFEEKEYGAEEIIQLLENIKKYSANGIRASMQIDIETGNYYMGIGNIINDNEVKWSDNKILIEDMEGFFAQYIDEFPTEGVEKRRNSKFYKKQYGRRNGFG